ncbi:Major facilitator superfamily domain, general substrate transporter [Niveomyces insectorum RCEF 264]|uniref:Major facilitator superfamily domain, general substrate transporter n=1 Tax=Niveomyces insectorum RCEF 264 TaxID=1081102 RepID=A0A167NGG1_9HYPO|nr:Major facilitator superfamily domain, general substrate transporter [Niveomyces insectorum RCEF 264]
MSDSIDATKSPRVGANTDDAEQNGAKEICADQKHEMETTYKQEGVQQVEAITQVWSSRTVIITFILIYLINFTSAMQQSIQQNLTPYVTSSFSAHGLLSTVGIVSTVIGGVSSLTIAKIIDIWGRIEGFCFMLLLITLGMIMKAVCKNVETYAAAQTLYWVGYLGLQYILSVVMADMTTLKNRMVIFGINQTPTIATVFAGSKISQLYYDNLNFRWAFGSWAIILVGVCIPIFAIFLLQARKAKRFGLYPEKPADRTFWEATKHYVVEFDVVNNESITVSGYVLNSFSLGASFLSPFVGLLIRSTGNYKWVAMSGVPFMVIGTALLIKFRRPDSIVNYLVMCQLLNGFGSGILSLSAQIAVMASVTHQEVAVVLAIYGLFGSIGASIGETIAGALWTNELPKQLYQHLPADSKNLTMTIYESIVEQESYPVGSPIRDAIIAAYANVMRKMVIAGACFLPPMVLCLFLWRNINLKTIEKINGTQSKGNIL